MKTKIFPYLLSLLVLACTSCKSLEMKCAERFPSSTTEVIRQTVRMDTIIMPWHTVEFLDTTICPPSVEPQLVIKTVIKKLPGDTIYHEVFCTDTVVIFQDQPKINYLTTENNRLQTALATAKGKSKTRTWVSIGGGLLSLLLLFLLIRRRK